MHRPQRGFTLIELLLVVAIIAILASIALPNFLEAQIRAKVAREHSDLRTMATALEAYTTDFQNPPFDGLPGTNHYGWVNALSQVTTPVAYLSTLPVQTFQDSTLADATRPGHTHFVGTGRHTIDYSTAAWEEVDTEPDVAASWKASFGDGARWKITSPGPDLRFINDGSFYGKAQRYDPTNGTTSLGDIVRSSSIVH